MMICHVHTCIQQDLHQVQASGTVIVAPVGAPAHWWEVHWREWQLTWSAPAKRPQYSMANVPSAMTSYPVHWHPLLEETLERKHMIMASSALMSMHCKCQWQPFVEGSCEFFGQKFWVTWISPKNQFLQMSHCALLWWWCCHPLIITLFSDEALVQILHDSVSEGIDKRFHPVCHPFIDIFLNRQVVPCWYWKSCTILHASTPHLLSPWKREHDGSLKGMEHPNLILDTCMYEVEFLDRQVAEYSVNVIAVNIYTQCGWCWIWNQYLLLNEIIGEKITILLSHMMTCISIFIKTIDNIKRQWRDWSSVQNGKMAWLPGIDLQTCKSLIP